MVAGALSMERDRVRLVRPMGRREELRRLSPAGSEERGATENLDPREPTSRREVERQS